MSDKTRVETARLGVAAEAMADQNGWTSYSDARKALAAADAHDTANGVHRVSLDEAAVERVAAVLAMKSYTTDIGIAFDDYKRVARAVLAATVNGDVT